MCRLASEHSARSVFGGEEVKPGKKAGCSCACASTEGKVWVNDSILQPLHVNEQCPTNTLLVGLSHPRGHPALRNNPVQTPSITMVQAILEARQLVPISDEGASAANLL